MQPVPNFGWKHVETGFTACPGSPECLHRFPSPTKPVEISLTKQGDYMFNKVPGLGDPLGVAVAASGLGTGYPVAIARCRMTLLNCREAQPNLRGPREAKTGHLYKPCWKPSLPETLKRNTKVDPRWNMGMGQNPGT